MKLDTRKLSKSVTRNYVVLQSDLFFKAYSTLEYYEHFFSTKALIRTAYAYKNYYYGPEVYDFGDLIFQKEMKNNGFLQKIFDSFYTLAKELELYISSLQEMNFDSFSDKEMHEEVVRFIDLYTPFMMSLLVFYFEPSIEAALRKELKGRLSINEDLAIITSPRKENFYVLEQKNILELAILLKKFTDYNSLPQNKKLLLIDHCEEFGWIGARGGHGISWTPEFIFKRMKDLNDTYEEQLLLLQKHRADDEFNSQRIIRELGSSKELIHLVDIAKELVYFRTFRTDYINKLFFLARPLLSEYAKRKNLSYEDIVMFQISEIKDDLKLSKKNLDERKEQYAIFMLEPYNTIFASDPDEIERLVHQHCEKEILSVSEVKGVVASKGCVKGRAKIVMNNNSLKKVERGDILITPMTTPDFLSAMEKASAFVTDEGGITCHAAIVSRELGKPCIIGTKFATKVFKDGDLIEVDAINGVVRKIK